MDAQKKREEVISSVKDSFGKELERVMEMENSLVNYAHGIMNNLAVISGALVTGSLVLLGSDMPASRTEVIIGIVALLLQIFFIFFYLLHNHGKSIQAYKDYRQRALVPSARLILLYDDLLNKVITEEFFDSEIKKTALEIKSRTLNNNLNLVNEVPYKNYWDSFFIVLLGLGTIFIAFGFLLPIF